MRYARSKLVEVTAVSTCPLHNIQMHALSYSRDSTARIADRHILAHSECHISLLMTGSPNANVILRVRPVKFRWIHNSRMRDHDCRDQISVKTFSARVSIPGRLPQMRREAQPERIDLRQE